MPNGGKLTIATNKSRSMKLRAHTRVRNSGDYVMLSVSDTGTGMTDEVKRACLRRFSRRSQRARAPVWAWRPARLLSNNPWPYRRYSEVGQGTTFKVYFPRVEQPLDVAPERSDRAAAARDGNLAGRGR